MVSSSVEQNPMDYSLRFSVNARIEDFLTHQGFLNAVLQKAGRIIAAYIVKNHLSEVLTAIDPERIAEIALEKTKEVVNLDS